MSKTKQRIISSIISFVLIFSACFQNMSAVYGADEARKIDVWDFGGVAQEGDYYVNHISAEILDGLTGSVGDEASAVRGKFLADAEITFGDVAIKALKNDRMYYAKDGEQGSLSAGMPGGSTSGMIAYDDGYTAMGNYYCNGTGGDNRRYVTIANVKAGDRVTVYGVPSNGAASTIYFTGTGSIGDVESEKAYLGTPARYDFIAEKDGTYKIWVNASAGKPTYNRVVRVPAVKVSGTITYGAGAAGAGQSIVFANQTTNKEIKAEVDAATGAYSVLLTPGYSYAAAFKGIEAVGFTNDTKMLEVKDSDVASGEVTKNFVTEEKHLYNATGEVKGFAADYARLGELKIAAVTAEDSLADDIEAEIEKAADGKISYTIKNAEPDEKYTFELKGVNDYEIIAGGTLVGTTDTTQDIEVKEKAKFTANGNIVEGPDFDRLVPFNGATEIKFVNVDDEYEYAGSIEGNKYSVSLRNGAYKAVITAENYKTSGHVVVNGRDVSKDVLAVSTKAIETPGKVSDLYVGYGEGTKNNYKTLKEAIAVANIINAKAASEESRLTIHIAPGVYREQVVLSAPYVTLKNDNEKEAKITWYYGIGYKYYSVDSKGYYNFENAFDKYEKNIVANWGNGVRIEKGATAFRAENITFEASFNKYMTDEEVDDGVEVSGTEKITFKRQLGADVKSKAATERATALSVYTDNYEFKNCRFLGSQDTLYAGDGDNNGYYKNCYIEGNTDFIFGDGNVVFDNCELNIYGYSDTAMEAYLTAVKDTGSKGYLFRGCTVTNNESMKQKPSYLGRPWGAKARVAFLNTRLENADAIIPAGWLAWEGRTPENANYKEYNTTYNGTAVDVAERTAGTVIDEETAKAITAESYFGSDWTPVYYTVETVEAVEFKTKPSIASNGDVLVPIAGNKFTVSYELNIAADNDNSLIEWYKVAADGTETLVKSSTANVDKSYLLQKSDDGCKIKVKVTPGSINGLVGAAEVFLNNYAVDGSKWIDPDDVTGIDPDADKINVYLAGDSTVKDYSAAGIYNKGAIEDKGSWGKFLQNFFDERYVNVMNYAQGGRSSRTFFYETDKFNKIKEQIKEGDYLFIQFGHNDCDKAYTDRYITLGTPDANGIYPYEPGTLTDKKDSSDNLIYEGGTYKWYIKQYVDMAKAAGANPVLCAPIARAYMNTDGTVRAHHFDTAFQTITDGNTYIDALAQVAADENIPLIDLYANTEAIYSDTYKNAGGDVLNKQIMCGTDTTHNGKLGGLVIAADLAAYIQNQMNNSLSPYVKRPAGMTSNNADNSVCFSFNTKGVFKGGIAGAANESVNPYVEALINEKIAEISTEATSEGNAEYTTEEITELIIDPIDDPNGSAEKGDVNGDGSVNELDAVAVLNGTLKDSLNVINVINADVDGDGKITANDAAKIMTMYSSIGDDNAPEKPIKLFVLGDSTACDYINTDLGYYYKRVGFGTALSNYFHDNVTIVNLAMSGRSSKSFLTEDYYKRYKNEVGEGDYVIIAWGHNDEKTEADRYTNPVKPITEPDSFKYSLYEYYIKVAQEKGAIPILATPIVRRNATGVFTNNDLHITAGNRSFPGGDYSKCIRDLGEELNIPVIDNTEITKNLHLRCNPDITRYFHAWTSSKPKSCDNTHLNNYGANAVAYLMSKEIKASGLELGKYVKKTDAPTRKMLEVNPDYKDPVKGELKKSQMWTTTDPWWGSVYGDVGGNEKVAYKEVITNEDGSITENYDYTKPGYYDSNDTSKTYYDIHENADGTVTIRAGVPASNLSTGKVASTNDGMAFYFRTESAESNFEIKAKATIKDIPTSLHNQISFGVIVSQDMETDKYVAGSYEGGYVAAGALNMTKIGSTTTETGETKYTYMSGAFQRNTDELGTLTTFDSTTTMEKPKVGDSFDVRIVKVGNNYKMYFNGEEYQTTADYSGDVYVGLFAVRCIEVEFSDIVFNNEVSE